MRQKSFPGNKKEVNGKRIHNLRFEFLRTVYIICNSFSLHSQKKSEKTGNTISLQDENRAKFHRKSHKKTFLYFKAAAISGSCDRICFDDNNGMASY